MPGQRTKLKWIVRIVTLTMIVYNLGQIAVSLQRLLQQGQLDIVQLTYVEAEHNQDQRKHPYYTVCPILSQYPNISEPIVNLQVYMVRATIYYRNVILFPLLNTQSLVAERYSTFLKTKDSTRDRKEILVQCQTLSIPSNVTLGQLDSKANLQILSYDQDRSIAENEYFTKEFRIYIHDEFGYVNSFMLESGQPHITIPGFDHQLGLQKPQMFHYIVRYGQCMRPFKPI